MDVNEYITLNYKTLRRTALNITGRDSLADDLLSESILILMEKPNVQAIVDSGGCMYYLIRIMTNQFRSTTSPFHKQYRNTVALPENYDPADVEEQDNTEMAKFLQKELNELHWYPRTLFELHYLKGESISKISRETKIPRSSITLELKRVKEHLKNRAEELLKRDL